MWRNALWALPLLGPFVRRLWGRAEPAPPLRPVVDQPGLFRLFCPGPRRRKPHPLGPLGPCIRIEGDSHRRGSPALFPPFAPVRGAGRAPPVPDGPGGLQGRPVPRMFIRPVRLYFNAGEREKWLSDMVAAGERNGLLTADEAARVRRADQGTVHPEVPQEPGGPSGHAVPIGNRFSDGRYCLCAPPSGARLVTASLQAGLIIAAFNLLPVSPGSLVRGFYVVGLCIRGREISRTTPWRFRSAFSR